MDAAFHFITSSSILVISSVVISESSFSYLIIRGTLDTQLSGWLVYSLGLWPQIHVFLWGQTRSVPAMEYLNPAFLPIRLFFSVAPWFLVSKQPPWSQAVPHREPLPRPVLALSARAKPRRHLYANVRMLAHRVDLGLILLHGLDVRYGWIW